MSFLKKTNSLVLALSLAVVTILSPTTVAYAEERVEVPKLVKKSQQVELTEEEAVTEEEEIQEAEVRAAPLIPIVLIIIRSGIMYIKYKNKVEEAYEKVKESYVRKEVEEHYPKQTKNADRDWSGDVERDTTLEVFRIKGTKSGIFLNFGHPDKFGMTHILARHHPEYWTGDYNGYGRDPLSMFNPETSISDIEEIIQDVMDDDNNPERIKEHIDNDKFSKKAYYGKSGGKKYKLVIDSGSITTIFPYGSPRLICE